MTEVRANSIRSTRKSAVRSGLLTGLGLVLSAVAAAGAAVLVAHKFGRSAATDGFFTAYGLYLVLVLGAQAFRLVVAPDLTRAADEDRLGAELRAYAVTFALVALPAVVLVIVFRGPIADAITGTASAAHEAENALPFFIIAAFGQLLGALLASALAARGSYGAAALGFGVGPLIALVVFAALADTSGLVSLAWGVTVNAVFVLAVTGARLLTLGGLGHGRAALAPGRRLWWLIRGTALPIALQGIYVVALRLAAGLGVGTQTTLSYGYVIAATFVAATASALALVSSVPLTRREPDAAAVAQHVVHTAWLSLTPILAAAGVFALVGGEIVGALLGSAYTGDVGSELGRLVVWLTPWMVATVAFTVAYPMLFVVGRGRRLVPLAVAALVVQVPLALGLREVWGLNGIALALGITTALVLIGVLAELSLRMLELTLVGVLRAALLLGALAVVTFGGARLVLGDAPAALAGFAAYTVILALVRPPGLRDAWSYVRALH
jgi:O-antigen/teichoic acid export membrane protein